MPVREKERPPVLTLRPCPSVAGTMYTVAWSLSVISGYNNGNAWSVVLGGVTGTSGPGSALAWKRYSFTVTCGATAASNILEFRMSSSNNRAATLQIDNVTVTVA